MAFVCFPISFFGEALPGLCKKSGGEVEFIAKMGCFDARWHLPDFERDTSAPGSLQSLPSFYLHPRIGGAASPRHLPAGTWARRVQIWRFRIESVYVCRSGSVFRHVFASNHLAAFNDINKLCESSWVITTLLPHSRDTPMASPLTPHVSSGFPDGKPRSR